MGTDAVAVVLLHGYMRTPRSMRPMERALRSAGFNTVYNIGYSSMTRTIESAAMQVAQVLAALEPWRLPHTFHFVTHSLGGLVLRTMWKHYDFPWGRTVMLGTPNNGSAVADVFSFFPVTNVLGGPMLSQMRVSHVASLPVVPTVATHADGSKILDGPDSIAIIAGTKPQPLTFSWCFPSAADNDGKVAVVETWLPGAPSVEVSCTHTQLPKDIRVQQHTINFLKTGFL